MRNAQGQAGGVAQLRARWVGAALAGLALTGAGLLCGAPAQAQSAPAALSTSGPVPAPVLLPPYFEAAVKRGTRTYDGRPGPAYFTNTSIYDIRARLDPATARLVGEEEIRYVNNGPVALRILVLHLYQNLHKPEAARNSPQEVTGGIELSRVLVGGVPLEPGNLESGPGYRIEGTVMTVRPPKPLERGDTALLSLAWAVTLPQSGAGRMGYSGKEVYFVGYWYPRMAVFDDLRGWDAEPYLSNAEFYDGFGDYRVALTVPEGWTVMATGRLVNGEEVYTPTVLARLAQAATSDEKVEVATEADLRAKRVTQPGTQGWLTYRFEAKKVRDFAWTTSNVQRWDAASAVVPDRDGDGVEDRVLIHSFWREGRAPLWEDQWLHAKRSIEHHSRFTGFPYPWPHMTSVEGGDIIRGGMEYPMLTLIGPYEGREPQALFSVTSHEIGHMWIPMIVASNETRNAWIDEGATTFLEGESMMALWPGVDHHRLEARSYLEAAAAGLEQPLMRHGDWYEPGPGYGVASYSKPATLMVALRDRMGWAKWEEAYRTFLAEWAYKHPTPWDFFHTFERFAGEDLDWFWTSFYFETWTVDFEAAGVLAQGQNGTLVRVVNRGLAPFPVKVRIVTTAGGVLDHDVPVQLWLEGKRWVEISVPASAGSVTRVEVDPLASTPDVERANNYWPRG